MLVRQVVLQFVALVILASCEDFLLVNQLGPQFLGDFQIILLVDDILDIVLGTLQTKGLDLGFQLLDDPLLESDFLEDRLMGVICNTIL